MTDYTEREVRELAKRGTDAMQQFIDGRHTLHVPPHPDDADMVIAECLSAVDAFADMLAAAEKAEPYATFTPDDMRSMWDRIKTAGEPIDLSLYNTHPAAQPRVQDGYVMVPIKPTEEMLAALDNAQAKWLNCESDTEEFGIRAWEAMALAAQEGRSRE